MGFNLGWLPLGGAGVAIVIVAFYIMICSDMQVGRWKRELGNITAPVPKTSEPSQSTNNDVFFDEKYEDWKNPFEEDKE